MNLKRFYLYSVFIKVFELFKNDADGSCPRDLRCDRALF